MIAIIDYDAGNLKSVEKALKSLNHLKFCRQIRLFCRVSVHLGMP